jgi:peptidyl-prolyl cis-trans isomerase-like protein 2
MTEYIFIIFAGDYHCPVTYKSFTSSSHIVAIKTTGNVYLYEAVEQLNIKPKHWNDLLDDTPFTKSDIITIQVLFVFVYFI